MIYKLKFNGKTHLIENNNVRFIYNDTLTLIPEMKDYSNWRYSVYPICVGDEIKWIVNLCLREATHNALLHEQIHISSPVTHYVRMTRIMDTFQEAVDAYHDLCGEFETHNNIKLHTKRVVNPPRKNKKETFST